MLMVILGAGASHDSYGSLTPGNRGDDPLADHYRPPLTKDLFEDKPPVSTTTRVLTDSGGWVAYMRKLIRQQGDGKVETVEDILARFSASPNPDLSKRATLAIRLFMQHMLTECQTQWSSTVTANVTNYGALLAEIAVAGIKQVCFVSFNYDTLFEQALPTIGVPIDSLESYVTHPAYIVVKPHGSLNWAHEVSTKSNFGDAKDVARWLIANAPELDPSPEFKFFRSPLFALGPGSAIGLWPAMALPIARKAAFECPDEHMSALDACVPKVSKLLTIGWRGAEQHFLERFAGKIPPVSALVVGRDRNDAEQIVATIQRSGIRGRFQMAEAGFSASLDTRIPAFLAEQLPTRAGR
jgi:hypothetical protein